MANVAEAQIIGNDTDAGGTAFGRVMDASNLFFTAVFTVELAINLFAHWLKPFLCNPWSLLDAFVVLMSLAALIPPVEIPITVLRLMRAFRVIRLFGRLKALKKMISALSASIFPMLNAFLILFIIASICGSRAACSLCAWARTSLCHACRLHHWREHLRAAGSIELWAVRAGLHHHVPPDD
jgi:hypothetical protein